MVNKWERGTEENGTVPVNAAAAHLGRARRMIAAEPNIVDGDVNVKSERRRLRREG